MEYTHVWSWEQSLALRSLSPAAKDLILSASKELFRALKADNLRNNISVDFPGCSWESAREILDLLVLVSTRGEVPEDARFAGKYQLIYLYNLLIACVVCVRMEPDGHQRSTVDAEGRDHRDLHKAGSGTCHHALVTSVSKAHWDATIPARHSWDARKKAKEGKVPKMIETVGLQKHTSPLAAYQKQNAI